MGGWGAVACVWGGAVAWGLGEVGVEPASCVRGGRQAACDLPIFPTRPWILLALTLPAGSPATLIGFIGTPWTLAAYAVEGKAEKDCKETKVRGGTLCCAPPKGGGGRSTR